MAKEIDIKNLEDIAAGNMDITLTEAEIIQILIQIGKDKICSLYCSTYPNGYGPITNEHLEEVMRGYYGLEAEGGKVKGYDDSRDTDVIVKR